MADITSILAAARLPEATVTLCLRGDLAADYEQLDRELAGKLGHQPTSLGDPVASERRDIAARMEALRREMQEHEFTFRLRALRRADFAALRDAHPDTADKGKAFDLQTFPPALVAACSVDPDMTVEQATELLNGLTEGQYDHLVDATWNLNVRRVDIPFSVRASVASQTSAPTL